MARQATFTKREVNYAGVKLYKFRTYLETHEPHLRKEIVLNLFTDLFQGKIQDTQFEYGIKKINENYAISQKYWEGFSRRTIGQLHSEELTFINKHITKKSLPSFLLHLLLNNFKEVVTGERLFPKLDDFQELIILAIEEMREEISKEDDFDKTIPLRDLERILRNPMYDIEFKKLIYYSEKKRLKKSLQLYLFEGLSKKPYSLFSRAGENILIEDFVFLCFYFKKELYLDKKLSFPPKRAVILETMKLFRDSTSSQDKIFGNIQKVFDPDYGQIYET